MSRQATCPPRATVPGDAAVRFQIKPSSAARFAPLLLLLPGCDGAPTGPVTATPPPPTSTARITVQAGNNQAISLGDWTSIPLVVRVTTPGGVGIPNATVAWSVTSGTGELATTLLPQRVLSSQATTDDLGNAQIFARFSTLGMSKVAASLVGSERPPVEFTLTVTESPTIYIAFGPMHDCTGVSDPVTFQINRAQVTELAVQSGRRVQFVYSPWLHPACRSRLVTISTPPGEPRIDSGTLGPGQSFEWTAGVTGAWRFHDDMSGGGITLHVSSL